jgi:F-type H+-transporting ATPase subunit a
MIFAAGSSWFHQIPGVSDDTLLPEIFGFGHTGETHSLLSAFLVCFVVLILAFFARVGLVRSQRRKGIEKYFADERLSFRNGAEIFVSGIKGMMSDLLEARDVRLFLLAIGGMFIYILIGNLMGLMPGFLPPTDKMTHNGAIALTSFFLFLSVGLSRDPIGFVKHLAGPVIFLVPLIFCIELLGLVLRPVTLSFRLSGNMFGDHAVFGVMSEMVRTFVDPVWGQLIPVPAIFLALGLVVSFIQAFVFSLLSTIYIGLSVPHHDHDDH